MLLEMSPRTPDAATDGAAADCRVFERTNCELPTTCQPASLLAMKEPGWNATISDLSQGGARLNVARRFEKGTPLAVELPGDRDRDASVVFVNVVNLKRADDGTWMLGCRFMSELSEDEMDRLLHLEPTPFPAAPAPTQPLPELAAKTPAAPEPIVETRILPDVYLQIAINVGCQMTFHFNRFNATKIWPLTPGKIVRFNGIGSDQTKWSLKVQLTECRQEGDAWHLKAKLPQAPNLTALLQALAD